MIRNVENKNIESHQTFPKPTSGSINKLSPSDLQKYLSGMDSDTLSKFMNYATQNRNIVAHISYWEKWLAPEQKDIFEKKYSQIKNITHIDKANLPLNIDQVVNENGERLFSEADLKTIAKNIDSIQLTHGCSKACKYCGFDAPKGVKDMLPYHQIINFSEKFSEELNYCRPHLYYASEPSDYQQTLPNGRGVNYLDVLKNISWKPWLTTTRSHEQKWLGDLKKDTKNQFTVSVFDTPDQKISDLENEIGRQHLSGTGEKHHRQHGINFNPETDQDISPLHCRNGILLTPRGIYNKLYFKYNSEQFPQGKIITPIEEIGSKDIEIGESIHDVLKRSVLGWSGNITSSVTKILFYSIYTNNKHFYVAFDQDLKVSKVADITDTDFPPSSIIKDERGILQKLSEQYRSQLYDRNFSSPPYKGEEIRKNYDEISRKIEEYKDLAVEFILANQISHRHDEIKNTSIEKIRNLV